MVNMHRFLRRACLCLAVLMFALVALAFLVPLVLALLPALTHTQERLAFSFSALARTAGFTLTQSLLSVAVALLLGFPAAFFLSQRRFFGQRFLYALSAVPFCVPTLIMALGFIATFGMAGWYNRWLMTLFKMREPPLTFLYSFWGIVLTQGFYNFPLVMVTVASLWTQLDTTVEQSAQLLGASPWRTFRTVTLPRLGSAIASSCIPVFLYCFFSFMIVLLFGKTGTTTLEVALYHAGRSMKTPRTVAVLAGIETACACAVLALSTRLEKNAWRTAGLSFASQSKLESRKTIAKLELIPASVLGLLVLFGFLLPLASICTASFVQKNHVSLDAWRRLVSMNGFWFAVKNTFATASATALCCTVTAFVYAVFLRLCGAHTNQTLLKTIPLLPMALSSVVMGIGLTMLVRRGSPMVLVLAQTALTWPFAFRQIFPYLAKIPDEVIGAAALLSQSRTDTIFCILMPYTVRGIASSFGFCLALSAGDATLPLVLAIPRFDTLSLFTYRLAGSFRFAEASASGCLLGCLCMVPFFIFQRERRSGI